jgi:hypothetical protein
MNCEKAQQRLTELVDLNESLYFRSPMLLIHLATCKSCRREARLLKQGLRVLQSLAKKRTVSVPPGIEVNVMELIAREAPLQNPGAQNPVSFRDWIVVGLILFIGLCMLPFSSESPYMLIITVSIFLTLYGSLLIGTHLEELSHFFGLKSEGHIPKI